MMKNCIYLFLSGMIIAGCGLQADSHPDLSGAWEWVQTYGGFAGVTLTPESEGYSQTLYFTKANSYLIVRNQHEMIRHGQYRFTTKTTGSMEKDAILFDHIHWEMFYRLSNDTLFLDPNCMDCFHDIYVRQK